MDRWRIFALPQRENKSGTTVDPVGQFIELKSPRTVKPGKKS
jgi:hypothetical protein